MNEWVRSNGGMKLTWENWSTGRKTLYSVGGRWMNEYGAMVEWRWHDNPKFLLKKPVPLSLCLPQILHLQDWHWNWVSMTRDRLLTSEALLALSLFYMSKLMSFHFRNCDVFHNTVHWFTCTSNSAVSLSFALHCCWRSLLIFTHLISSLSRFLRVLSNFILNDSHYICDRTRLDHSDLDPPKG